MSQGDWEKDRGAGSRTVRHDAGSRPARSSDPGTQTTRQQVGPGSRAPGRRLSVEMVPGSRGHMKEGLCGSHCIWGHSFHRTHFQKSFHASRRGPKDPIGRKYGEKADPHMMVASLPQTRRPV